MMVRKCEGEGFRKFEQCGVLSSLKGTNMAPIFVAFQRHPESDPWGHEVIINFDNILKIEVLYFTKPDANNRSYRLDLKSGRDDVEAERWYEVYLPGEKVTVTKRHGKVFDMIEKICNDSIKTNN
jgi:hypothetical protein